MALPDDFTGANGTTLQAYSADWVPHPSYSGIFEIQSDRAVVRATGANAAYYYDQAPSGADYTVSAIVNWSSVSQNSVGITGRMSSSANTFYHARISSSNVQLFKFVAGTATQLGSSVASGVGTNTDAFLELVMTGTTIEVYLDSALKISVTDSAITAAGYAGIRGLSGHVNLAMDEFDMVEPGGGITLTGNNCDQINTSTSGAISQTHVLAGNDCAQVNTSTSGAISQTHILAGNDCAQTNTSTSGAISQTHVLAGNDCRQVNTCTSGAVSQTHVLTGNDCRQVNTSTSGAVSQGVILTGANCAQVNTSTSGAVVQTHVLTGANCAQRNTSTSGAISTGSIVLAGANCVQANRSSAGAITQTHILAGANCRQRNTCGYANQPITRPGVTITGDTRRVNVASATNTVTIAGNRWGVSIGMKS